MLSHREHQALSTALQQVSSPMILMPAYGRTYPTKDAMLQDWQAGKDFRIVGHGQYCSIRDIEMMRAEASSVVLYEPRLNATIKV